MFAIAVRFVTGRYYAASYADRTQPEWPPHPDRLFSALVAACYQSCDGSGRSALGWLEQQGLPLLVAPQHTHSVQAGRPMLAMVRTNDAESSSKEGIKVLPERRTPQPRFFPSIVVDTPVYFIWPDTHPDEETARDLAKIIAHLAYLGSSKSPVIAWIEEDPPMPTLLPSVESWESVGNSVILRVPTPGRLAELESQFAAGLRPLPGHQHPYRWKMPSVEVEQLKPHPSVFGKMFVFARIGGPALSLEATLIVTHALRRALLAIGEEPERAIPGMSIPELLHGHGPKGSPHCAFITLPYVGASYADGHLLGVAVVFPQICDLEQRRAVVEILSNLNYIQTPLGQIFVTSMAQKPPDALPRGLQIERWCGSRAGVTTWTSVTPVLFDHFPRPSRGGVLGAVQALARHVGLPMPIEAVAHQISPITGVPVASTFRVRRSDDEATRYVAHLTVTFDQPVQGPILLGAGRFFGLGLLVPHSAEMSEGPKDVTEL